MALYCAFIVEVEHFLDSSARLFREVLLRQEQNAGDASLLPAHVVPPDLGGGSQDDRGSSLLDAIRVGPGRGVSLRDTIAQLFNNYMTMVLRDLLKYISMSRERKHALRDFEMQQGFEHKLIERLSAAKPELQREREQRNLRRFRELDTQVSHLRALCDELEAKLAEELRKKVPPGTRGAGGQIITTPSILPQRPPPSTPACPPRRAFPPLWQHPTLWIPDAGKGVRDAPVVSQTDQDVWIVAAGLDQASALFENPQAAPHAMWAVSTLQNCFLDAAQAAQAVGVEMYAGVSCLFAVSSGQHAVDLALSLHYRMGKTEWPEGILQTPAFRPGGKDGVEASLASTMKRGDTGTSGLTSAEWSGGLRLRVSVHSCGSGIDPTGAIPGGDLVRAISLCAVALPGETVLSGAAAQRVKGTRAARHHGPKLLAHCLPLRGCGNAEAVYVVGGSEDTEADFDAVRAADLFSTQWAACITSLVRTPPPALPPTGVGALMVVRAPTLQACLDARLPAAALDEALAMLLTGLREAASLHGGVEILDPLSCAPTPAFAVRFVFRHVPAATAAALQAQEQLVRASWPDELQGCGRMLLPGVGIQVGHLAYELRAGGGPTSARLALVALRRTGRPDTGGSGLAVGGGLAMQADAVGGVARAGETVVTRRVFNAVNTTETLRALLKSPSFRVFSPTADPGMFDNESLLFSVVPACLASNQQKWRPDASDPPPPVASPSPRHNLSPIRADALTSKAPAEAATCMWILALAPWGLRDLAELEPPLRSRAVRTFVAVAGKEIKAAGGTLLGADEQAGGHLVGFPDGPSALTCALALQLQLLSADWEPRLLHFAPTREVSADGVLLFRGVRARCGLDFGDGSGVAKRAAALSDVAHGGEIRVGAAAQRQLYGWLRESEQKWIDIGPAPEPPQPLSPADLPATHYRVLPAALGQRAVLAEQEAAGALEYSQPVKHSIAADADAVSELLLQANAENLAATKGKVAADVNRTEGAEEQWAAKETSAAVTRLTSAGQQPVHLGARPPPPEGGKFNFSASGLPYAHNATTVRSTDPVSVKEAAADDAAVLARRRLLGEWLVGVERKEDESVRAKKENPKDRKAAAVREAKVSWSRAQFRGVRLAFEIATGVELAAAGGKEARAVQNNASIPALCAASCLVEVGIQPPASVLSEPERRLSFEDLVGAIWHPPTEEVKWWVDRYGAPGHWGSPPLEPLPEPEPVLSASTTSVPSKSVVVPSSTGGSTIVSPPPVPVLDVAPANQATPPPKEAAKVPLRRLSTRITVTQPAPTPQARGRQASQARIDTMRDTREMRRKFQEDKQKREEEEEERERIRREEQTRVTSDTKSSPALSAEKKRLDEDAERERRAEARKRRRAEEELRMEREKRMQSRRDAAQQAAQAQRTMAHSHRALKVLLQLLENFLQLDEETDAPTQGITDAALLSEWMREAEPLAAAGGVDEATLEEPLVLSVAGVETGEKEEKVRKRLMVMTQFVAQGMAVSDTGCAHAVGELNRSMIAVMCKVVDVVQRWREGALKDRAGLQASLDEVRAEHIAARRGSLGGRSISRRRSSGLQQGGSIRRRRSSATSFVSPFEETAGSPKPSPTDEGIDPEAPDTTGEADVSHSEATPRPLSPPPASPPPDEEYDSPLPNMVSFTSAASPQSRRSRRKVAKNTGTHELQELQTELTATRERLRSLSQSGQGVQEQLEGRVRVLEHDLRHTRSRLASSALAHRRQDLEAELIATRQKLQSLPESSGQEGQEALKEQLRSLESDLAQVAEREGLESELIAVRHKLVLGGDNGDGREGLEEHVRVLEEKLNATPDPSFQDLTAEVSTDISGSPSPRTPRRASSRRGSRRGSGRSPMRSGSMNRLRAKMDGREREWQRAHKELKEWSDARVVKLQGAIEKLKKKWVRASTSAREAAAARSLDRLLEALSSAGLLQKDDWSLPGPEGSHMLDVGADELRQEMAALREKLAETRQAAPVREEKPAPTLASIGTQTRPLSAPGSRLVGAELASALTTPILRASQPEQSPSLVVGGGSTPQCSTPVRTPGASLPGGTRFPPKMTVPVPVAADAAGNTAVLPQYGGRPTATPHGVVPFNAPTLACAPLRDWWHEQGKRLKTTAPPSFGPMVGGDTTGLSVNSLQFYGQPLQSCRGPHAVYNGDVPAEAAYTLRSSPTRRGRTLSPPAAAFHEGLSSCLPRGVDQVDPRLQRGQFVLDKPRPRKAASGITAALRASRDRCRLQRIIDEIYKANVAGETEAYPSDPSPQALSIRSVPIRTISPPRPGSPTPLGGPQLVRPTTAPVSTGASQPHILPQPKPQAGSPVPLPVNADGSRSNDAVLDSYLDEIDGWIPVGDSPAAPPPPELQNMDSDT
eukprot:Hpha_TRINITY_DN9340_c0_g1::TRINITY_DN9340_c0_g1_i1::g.25814::m.25814